MVWFKIDLFILLGSSSDESHPYSMPPATAFIIKILHFKPWTNIAITCFAFGLMQAKKHINENVSNHSCSYPVILQKEILGYGFSQCV